MELQKRLISFRKNIMLKRKLIIDTYISNHSSNICVFCATKNNITKEHVLPKWTFEGCTKKYFNTSTNGVSQTYNRTVVPCCKHCNGFILGHLEHRIKHIFKNSDLNVNHFKEKELELIILWLETIAYKLQVMDIRRKFNKAKDSEYIPFLANFPIAIMQNHASLNPSKVFSNFRNSLKRLTTKSKFNRFNSLVVFKTKNPDFNFMHSSNNFIYLELPKYKVAFFYFIIEDFDEHKKAFEKSMKIIKEELYSEENNI